VLGIVKSIEDIVENIYLIFGLADFFIR